MVTNGINQHILVFVIILRVIFCLKVTVEFVGIYQIAMDLLHNLVVDVDRVI